MQEDIMAKQSFMTAKSDLEDIMQFADNQDKTYVNKATVERSFLAYTGNKSNQQRDRQ
jgi:hypothetical protein